MIKYSLSVSGKRAFSGMYVEKEGETAIYFKGTNKTNSGNSEDNLFEFMNLYFDSLDRDVIERHWQYLKEAKRIIEPGYFDEEETEEIIELRDRNLEYNFLCNKIYPIFVKIYQNINPSDITFAADALGYTKPPHDLNAITKQGDYPEETTINEIKYRELAKLAFITQLIYPVINQLLDHITFITGKEYRDAVVGDLVARLNCIVEQPGYRVLDTYLRASCKRQDGKRTTTAVSSEIKYIDHIVYKGLFNKLCLTFLPSKVKGKNLSNELNSLVAGEIRAENDSKFKSITEPKPTGDDLSVQEGYNISQETNASDELSHAEYFTFDLIVEVEPGVFIKKEKDFFRYQCLGLGIKNQYLAEKIYNTLPKNWGFHLNDLHIKLLQLTFQNDINYMLYEAFDYDQLMAALSLCQVKLFELGFEHLAVCAFAAKNESLPKAFIDDTFKLNTRERDMLVDICSDYIGQQTGTTDNSAVVSVNGLLDELASCGWESNIEPGLLSNPKYVELMSPHHRYPIDITCEIKLELLQLIMLFNGSNEE